MANDAPFSVATGEVEDVTDTSAVLTGEVEDLGEYNSADVHFEWRKIANAPSDGG